MKLFDWLRGAGEIQPRAATEIKRSATGPLVALHMQGRPVWTPRNYADLAREGYAHNAIGYRCVRMIAEAAASVPWLLYQGPHELEDHPLLHLLGAPSPGSSGIDLLEQVYGFLQTAGNSYMEAVSVEGRVRELHALRPDRMQIVAGPNGWPDGFDYTACGQTVRFDQRGRGQRPILHLKLFNPTHDHYGLSPFEPAARSIDVHGAAGAWSKGLLDNAARPSGALIYGGQDGAGSLSEEQFGRLKEELEQSFQGAANAGRPLVLEGGLDWKAMSYSPKDMDFIEVKHVAAREIALAFGVPPMLLGIPGDNTFSNYAEANRTFWRQTVLPLVGRTSRALTQWLAPSFGRDLRLWYDADQVEALSAEREALWSRLTAAKFLTPDEKRDAVGYGPTERNATP